MSLKKFTLTNLLLTFILIFGGYYISKSTKYYIDDQIIKFEKYSTLENNSVKIVTLGSSHGAYGIFFPLTDKEKINLAHSSQSLYYDFQLLKKYSDKIDKGAIIIIPISMFSFYSHYREDINQTYVPLLEKENILNMDTKTYYLIKNFSIFYPPSNVIEVLKNLKSSDDLISGVKYPRNLELEERKAESESTALSHLGLSAEYYAEKNAEIDFINLIEYIEQNNWQPILITTPFLNMYNENIEKYQKNAFKERIYENIKIVEEKLNKNFIYLDYSHDKRFKNNLDYFFDDDHLNEKGAKYFTQILLEDIKEKLNGSN